MKTHSDLPTFDNDTGEGIVAFEPWATRGPEHDADKSRWFAHVTVGGQRVFEYGCPCGTCGIVFRRVGTSSHRIGDEEAPRLLGRLDSVPPLDVLRRLSRPLPRGKYHAFVAEDLTRRVEPGAPDDYFATDVVRLFGLEPPECLSPGSPRTSYYRLGADTSLPRTGRLNGPHRALLTRVVMPLHAPERLDRERVAYWKGREAAGHPLTAVAVSVLDVQAPALEPPDATYAYEEQFLLTHCLLDGHHRLQAAAEMGRPIRILSLLSAEHSLARDPENIRLALRTRDSRTEG